MWCRETGTFVLDSKERLEGAGHATKEFGSMYKQLFGSSDPRDVLSGSKQAGGASIRPQSRWMGDRGYGQERSRMGERGRGHDRGRDHDRGRENERGRGRGHEREEREE